MNKCHKYHYLFIWVFFIDISFIFIIICLSTKISKLTLIDIIGVELYFSKIVNRESNFVKLQH